MFNRLVGAAYDQASDRKRPKKKRPSTLDGASADQIPASQDGDPAYQAEINDTNQISLTEVLNRVITQVNARPGRGRITPAQAALLSRTYLGGEPLKKVAADLKLSAPSASKQRKRAATLIAQFLGQPERAAPPPPKSTQPSPTAPPRNGPPPDTVATPPPAAG